jgi:GR25 family glycosyltransferase involved in LPS biosynthesis
MNIFVINLKRRKDRLDMMNIQLRDFSFKVIEAIDGGERIQQSYTPFADWIDPLVGRTLTLGEIATSLSHINAWKAVKDSNEPAIILEDDCLPSLSFFKYCEILLNRFKNYKSISMISGRNNLEKINLDNSYYFTFGSTWGWATWKRAWKFNDSKLKNWKNKKFRTRLNKNLKDYPLFYNLLIEKCEKIFKKKINSVWDYQWLFSVISRNMIAVVPKINLVKNIGFDKRSTHTHNKDSQFHSKINSFEIEFPLNHNNDYKINKKLVLLEHTKLYKPSVMVLFKRLLLNFYNKCQ